MIAAPGFRHEIEVHETAFADHLLDVYRRSYYDRSERPYLRPARRGEPGAGTAAGGGRIATCALDLRRPLSASPYLVPTADAMVAVLGRLGIEQVAGAGFGAFGLVGAVLARGTFRSALVRPAAKAYGFRERIEGDLDPEAPTAILDDLLATGRSALATAAALRDGGYLTTLSLTVFRFGWGPGRERLRHAGLTHHCLASLWPAS